MPLPPLLAARLAKRGLLSTVSDASNQNEEVIAEDYDDSRPYDRIQETTSMDLMKGFPGCPNKSNIYHMCSPFCAEKWKNGVTVPDAIYLENKRRVLELWPLPAGWEEVWDPGCGQHYYWNVHTNRVSWLPPSHPRAQPGESAAQLREDRINREDDSEGDDSASDQEVPQSEPPQRNKHKKEKKDYQPRDRKRPKAKDNDLDPMDPAAYSDIARGGWNAGLDSHEKTGVDTTASGQLYQMRPYPAPGAILAANAKTKPPISPPPSKKMYPSSP